MPGFLYVNYHHVENDVLYIGCTGSGLQFIVNIRIEIRKNVFRDKQWNMLLITERLTKKFIENMKKRLKAEKIFSPYLTEEYPIWWHIAAWPVDGFIEANDFTGKTVIPFCTSSSSDLGESGELLAEATGTGEWLEGARFASSASGETVRAWVEGLDL